VAADVITSWLEPSWVTVTFACGGAGSRNSEREARSRARWSASIDAARAADRRVGRSDDRPRIAATPTAAAATVRATNAGTDRPAKRRRRRRAVSGLVGGIAAAR